MWCRRTMYCPSATLRERQIVSQVHRLTRITCATEMPSSFHRAELPDDFQPRSFCSVADAALAEMRVKERGGHEWWPKPIASKILQTSEWPIATGNWLRN